MKITCATDLKSPKKLICFDLDGTLSQHKSHLPQANKDLIKRLDAKYKIIMVGAGNAPRIYNQMEQYPIDTSMMGDNNMNFTDSELFGQAYWSSVSTSQPYSFYLVDWDYEQTALAYAVDTNGLAGGVGRMLTCATAENKNDIEELRALVDELNAASKSSFSMPTSIVVSEGLKFDVISSEVELPVVEAQAEVKAAPAVVETNAVKVGGYIRPFYM